MPHSPTPNHPPLDDSDDDFDRRFGHLIGPSANDPPDSPAPHRDSDASSDASVDDDLVVVLDKVPNWEPGVDFSVTSNLYLIRIIYILTYKRKIRISIV